ncbi:unnamed protein product [Cylindrotheca closterium]|uniref:Uncharacterized protein n=1 Tax=Cylindrotheca closterium TaxID=2856 RepID=A0AAD2G3Z8_9STRA|nr:unnamed protein product [Cylindrotheca closterium]
MNRFSGSSQGRRGLADTCRMPQRNASVANIDTSARSEGTETTDGCDVYVDEFNSSAFSAITLEEDPIPSSRPRRRGSNLTPLQEQKALPDRPSEYFEYVERLKDSSEEHTETHRNLNRFADSFERSNPCPMPQRNASIANIDISSRSGGTASVTNLDSSSRSTVTATTATTIDNSIIGDAHEIKRGKVSPKPLHRRHGSNLCPLQELNALSDHPSEYFDRLLDSSEEHRNMNRFSGTSERGIGNHSPILPQRNASAHRGGNLLDHEEVQHSSKPCAMPQRQASLRHWESDSDDHETHHQACPMPQRKRSSFEHHGNLQQSYQDTFFLKEEMLFQSINDTDEDTDPVWSQKMHEAVRKYQERNTDMDSETDGDFLGYSHAAASLELVDVFDGH